MVTTNARWFKTPAQLRRTLKELRDRGYDGSFGVSVDAFHGKSVEKPALFIRTALEIWNRPDVARDHRDKGRTGQGNELDPFRLWPRP